MGDETCGAACRGGDCDIGASDGKVDTAASASSPGTSAFVPTCRLECALNHWASVRCAMGVTAATLAALLTAARYGALQALVAHGILLWFALRAVGLGTGFLARRAGVARGVRPRWGSRILHIGKESRRGRSVRPTSPSCPRSRPSHATPISRIHIVSIFVNQSACYALALRIHSPQTAYIAPPLKFTCHNTAHGGTADRSHSPTG